MVKTTTSFQVCYLDSKGNKVIKNIKEITPEEKPNIAKMYILRKGKTSEIGDFTSALKGFVNLETLYGPAGVTSFKVKSLTKGEVCPNLKNYVGLANEDDVYTAPKFVSSNGVAFNNEDTPSSVGAFASLSTDGEVVSGFVSADDFYNTVVKSGLGETEPTSIVTFKVNPSKTDLTQGPKVPGTLRQKANEIRASQEAKENTVSILNVVSALKDNGVNLTKEQESRLLDSIEGFVVANKGLSREDAEAMRLGLQEDIYNVGVKLADISDDNTEKVADAVASSKNEILDRLQGMSKKAEQTSANDRAVNFAEHSKTRTVVANEGKRTTQETVSALKDYLASEEFAKFVAESTPVDSILGGVEKIVGEQNNDIAYLLQEVGVNLSEPQKERLTEAFKEGLEESATGTTKTVGEMIASATSAVKDQMTVEGVKLTKEQEKFFTDSLSRKFLEERIMTENTIKAAVGKATSATIARVEDVYARLNEEMTQGFAMVNENVANAVDSVNANTNKATSGLGDDHVHLFAQGEDILAQGEKTRETLEKKLSDAEAINKALQAKLDESNKKLDAMNEKFDMIQNALNQMLQAQGQMKNEILGVVNAQATRTQNQIADLNGALRAEINSLAQVARVAITPQQTTANVGASVGGQNTNANTSVTSTKTDSQQGVTGNITEDAIRKIVVEELKKIASLSKENNSQETSVKNDSTDTNKKIDGKEQGGKSDGDKVKVDKVDDKTQDDKNKIKVLKNVTKVTTMLAEPKLPWYKRMGKFIVRHPFRSMLMGLGAGALVATGVGAIALGGFAPAIATANAFFPTIAVGGVAGAGLGAVGSVASRFSSKGRRERAYTKFMKKYKKAQKKAEKVEEKDAELVQLKAKKQDLREKDRSGNLFAKVGVYKAARHINRMVFKSTSKKRSNAIASYYNKIEEASAYKSILNNMEAKSGVTTAHGGALQKRNKINTRLKNNKITEAEAMEDLEDLDFDYPGISEVGKDYKTGDTEMMSLYEKFESIKGVKLSNRSSNMKTDINKRNPSPKVVVKEETIIEKEDDPKYKAQKEEIDAYKKAKEEGLIDENDNYIGM